MKVKIFTEGGKNIGLGHISRCMSLYNEVTKREILVDFIINGDVRDVNFLKGIRISNLNWSDERYLINSISADDYVIIDSYKAEKAIYDTIVKLSRRALFIDDFSRIEYPEGIIVNPSIDASYIDYSCSKNSILLSGPEYVILRPPFTDVKKVHNINDIKRVLITMGGTDIRKLMPLLINNFCKNNLDIEFDIVAGSYESEDYYNQLLGSTNVSVHTNINATQMMELMISSDLAITAAGQTIYELLATQTPFIPIQIIENQENNIRSLLKFNPDQIVLKYDDADLIGNLNKTLELFNCTEYKKNYNLKYNNIIDGYGSKRIVDYLLKDTDLAYEISLRKVKQEDMKEVFYLSNQDYVRRYSINKEKIQWADHVQWFNLTLKDRDTVFYVVTDKNESFLGQIRYKISNNSATVSISLSKKLKGKGFSKEILYQSIKKFFEENQFVNEIISYVSEDNLASKKIFLGLNFERVEVEDRLMKLILIREDFYVN